ncbi:sulfurtransferase [Nocardioides sp. AX2bis]|uniref:sulfurtransferase n=1 Tax=Nocardioides sp. AX2bis TaxID=2653157 RepID=UPI0012F2AB8F|nr:sulfurtransferase [Nocardioides sp. AX2bis]VXB33623.1 putative 3-mercaptopyruvate sulfurtransferase [Nocardioides sp. AX2bis]
MPPTPLLDVTALQALLARDDPRRRGPRGPTVLDVRWRLGDAHGAAAYAAGHVPGAAYVDLPTDLAGPAAPDGRGGRHPLPDPDRLAEALRRVGVDDGRPVVVYDDWGGRAAARAWWLLRWLGHDDVRVLDGGWSAWVAAGAAVEETATAERPSRRGTFTPRPGSMPVVDAAGVAAGAAAGAAAVLVDARDAPRYAGEHEPVDPVAGHVPGAVNVPTGANLDDTGRFLPAGRLRETYARVGAVAGTPVVAYCGSGITACHDVLALEVAGVPAALYAGSWSDWVSDPWISWTRCRASRAAIALVRSVRTSRTGWWSVARRRRVTCWTWASSSAAGVHSSGPRRGVVVSTRLSATSVVRSPGLTWNVA